MTYQVMSLDLIAERYERRGCGGVDEVRWVKVERESSRVADTISVKRERQGHELQIALRFMVCPQAPAGTSRSATSARSNLVSFSRPASAFWKLCNRMEGLRHDEGRIVASKFHPSNRFGYSEDCKSSSSSSPTDDGRYAQDLQPRVLLPIG